MHQKKWKSKINPIHPKDLADYITDIVVNIEKHKNVELDVGGPDEFDLQEIVSMGFEICQRSTTNVTHFPDWLLNSTSYAMKFINENASSYIKMMTEIGKSELVAPKYGNYHLRDYFEQLYLGEIDYDLKSGLPNGYRRVSIPSKTRYLRKIFVKESEIGDEISWFFKIVQLDIGFGIFHVDNTNQRKEIRKIEKYTFEKEIVGSIILEKIRAL